MQQVLTITLFVLVLALIGADLVNRMVAAGMSERAGHKISFFKFMALGLPVTFISLLISTGYVLLRYYA